MTQFNSECTNREAFQIVFSSLFTVAARRTSEAFAAVALSSVKDSLKLKYSFDFLNYVTVSENDIEVEGNILETVDKNDLVDSFDSIIRVVYTDLDEKAGLFFIKELKEEMGSSLVHSLAEYGLNFDLMAMEQRHLQRRRSEKRKQNKVQFSITLSKKTNHHKMHDLISMLSSQNITSCQLNVEDKTCLFFDNAQSEIAEYSLEYLLKSLIQLSKSNKQKNEIVFSEKTIHSFLNILQSNQQVSISEVQKKFNFSTTQVDQLIRHLLKKRYVRYQTISQIVITDLGKKYLQQKPIETK